MHVNRIYGGAVIGGGVAGVVFGFGVCLLMGIVWALALGDITQVGLGAALGLFGAFIGVFVGMAVGVGASIAGAITALVAWLFGERVSTPMMIMAGAVGTMPVTMLLLNPIPSNTLHSPPVFLGPPDLAIDTGITIVVAAIAAVSLDWLFNPTRRFGGLDAGSESEDAQAEDATVDSPL